MNKTIRTKMYFKQQQAFLNTLIDLYEVNPAIQDVKVLSDYGLVFATLDKSIIKKVVNYGVRAVANCPKSVMDETPKMIYDATVISFTGMKYLNIYDLIDLFPIGKTYDGDKYGTKDYFYAKEMVKTYTKYEDFVDMEDLEFEFLLSDLNSDVLFSYLCKYAMLGNMREKIAKDVLQTKWKDYFDKKFDKYVVVRKAGVLLGRD